MTARVWQTWLRCVNKRRAGRCRSLCSSICRGDLVLGQAALGWGPGSNLKPLLAVMLMTLGLQLLPRAAACCRQRKYPARHRCALCLCKLTSDSEHDMVATGLSYFQRILLTVLVKIKPGWLTALCALPVSIVIIAVAYLDNDCPVLRDKTPACQ